ncbi:tetratricopeptide repeat protein [Amycolatopsis sp. NPDC004625]|uniref:tetratricopeptide repeat protein n=1 Tax=Amycolatopsis sp. NPDC004625 TaxID=3154670 RepID=UPI0033AF51FF
MSDAFADLDAALGRFDGAAALAACEELGPKGGARAAAGRVRALWLLRRWNEGRAELAKLSAVSESVHVELARGIVALGQPDDPLFPVLDRGSALRDADRALEAFRSASALDPANAEAMAGQATALRMSGRLDEAENLLDRSQQLSSAVRVERALCLVERGQYADAISEIELILDLDPDDFRAAIVRVDVLRVDRNHSAARAAADLLGLRFPHDPRVLTTYAWLLANQGEENDDREAFEAALAVFEELISIDILQPRVVLGSVICLLALGDTTTARELSDSALQKDPLSPQLNVSRARVLIAENAPPPKIVAAHRHVLEMDPRMFRENLRLASALIDLYRREEAREVLAAFSRQYPQHPEAFNASRWLDSPWRMPQFSAITTRVDHPWLAGQDHPEKVLGHLIGEVARTWQLSPTATERLRDRVELDRNAVLEQAFSYEQRYLSARNKYRTTERRGRIPESWRLLGHLLSGTSIATGIVALPWLVWLIGQSSGLTNGWHWTLTAGIPVLLAGIALLDNFHPIRIRLSTTSASEMIYLVFALSVPPAAIWQGIHWFGTPQGILIGSTVSIMAAVAYQLGKILRENTRINESRTQGAFDEWLEYLYGAGLLPLAAEVSGELSSPYDTVLPSTSKIVSEAVVDIDTPATNELRQLLRQRSKGSFALAGPRGAGKSTLLERWCAGQLLRDTGAQEARRDLTVRVDAPVGYQSKDFLTHLFGRLCDEVETYATDHDAAIDNRGTRAAGESQSVLLRLFRETRAEHRPGRGVLTASELLHQARSERNKLRYLQSRTTEGELSFGAPPVSGATIGFKRKTSVKRDDVPLNHPQLVDRFRAFLGLAAEVVRNLDGKVLIGIDELDRISDGEGAQQFLNELKAVFNVPNCYFLVSVSEDALADFELSAMGMRTVFDSAFDTIVRVDYLTFDQAKLLLNRRVVDLPEQFAALAYVISGGLARELVRLSEAISDHKPSEKLELADVAARLVRRQLGRTTRAAMDRLSRSADRRAGASLIPVLDEHPVDELTGDLLRSFAERIAATGAGDEESGFVDGVRLDVAVMAEYLAVLLDVFDHRLDEPRMAVGAVRGPGGFETLARARRYLGANPHGARELVIAFRKAWDQLASA